MTKTNVGKNSPMDRCWYVRRYPCQFI